MDGQRVSEGCCCHGAGVRQDDEGCAGGCAGGLAGTVEGPLQRSEAGLCVGWGEGEALPREQGGVSVMGGPERPVLGRARVVALRAVRNVQGRGEVLRVAVNGFVQHGSRVGRGGGPGPPAAFASHRHRRVRGAAKGAPPRAVRLAASGPAPVRGAAPNGRLGTGGCAVRLKADPRAQCA
jgi:hypothetical protein